MVETVAEAEALELPDPAKVAYITQTTLSVDDCAPIVETLKRRFPAIREPAKDDICYATQNRQNAVKELARRGAARCWWWARRRRSNANRLVEVARARGARAYLIEYAEDIEPAWLDRRDADVGVTAGASTPEDVVQAVCARLQELGGYRVEALATVDEGMRFALPAELKRDQRSASTA